MNSSSKRPGRTRLSTFDRILWIWLYRVWPGCLNIMVLVKPVASQNLVHQKSNRLIRA
jgi:hypothetical protein